VSRIGRTDGVVRVWLTQHAIPPHYWSAKAERKAGSTLEERLALLNDYVQTISDDDATSPRTANRTRLYQECSARTLHLLATLSSARRRGQDTG